MTLYGATAQTVRAAIATDDPFPGTTGFAGEVDELLVRDVLGRELLFVERSDRSQWARSPASLSAPVLLAPGTVESRATEQTVHTWSLPASQPSAAQQARRRLFSALERTLESVPPSLPVAFSGGVDSAILATATTGDLYVAGFPESHDRRAARTAAATLDRRLTELELTHEQLRDTAVSVSRAIGRTNPMDVAIAIPLYLVAQQAAADGYDRLVLGQGADELFGGYAKVTAPASDDRVTGSTVREARDELIRGLPEQLERDIRAVRAGGVDPVVPYLHDRVIEATLRLPESLLVSGDRRKVALREFAEDRLPESITERDKKALQYGSLVSRELDRLARQAGFKRRMDNHVEQYIHSLRE